MQQTLTDNFYNEMERFFTLAKEQGVENVSIDCRTRTVNVSFGADSKRKDTNSITEGGDAYLEHYTVMHAKYMDERRCEDVLQRKKDDALTDLTRSQLLHIISEYLGALLRSDFLLTDKYDIEPEQLAVAEQLEGWGIEREGNEQKFALLCQMLTLTEDKLEVNEQVAGKYMYKCNESLKPLDTRRFFRFVGICQVVHREVRLLTSNTFLQLSDNDRTTLTHVCALLEKGDWQKPATFDNVSQFISTLFGEDTKMLSAEDKEQTRDVRDFFKKGRGERVVISTANIVGFLMRYQLIGGGALNVSKTIFGNDDQVNNINKGKNGDASKAFTKLEPLLDKYRKKIIGE